MYRYQIFSLIVIGFVLENHFQRAQEFDGVCYENLNCYEQAEPWVSVLRPLPKPESPDEIQPEFFLVTRKSQFSKDTVNQYKVKIDPDFTPDLNSLYSLDYNPQRQLTVFITHGYYGTIKWGWMTDLAQAYLTRSDANIFLLNWEKGASSANYYQVAANIRVLGDILFKFWKTLIDETYLFPMQIHCIGHSLGAHTCGYAGKQIPGIYLITGLDVASPAFEGHKGKVRLNKGDAKFIHAIHTNGMVIGFGYRSSIGDVDHYINGGKFQLECTVPSVPKDEEHWYNLPFDVLSFTVSCSHSKSIVYYTEAVGHPECVMWGHKLDDLDTFLDVATLGTAERLSEPEECDLDKCSPLGLETVLFPARGEFYVTTHLEKPFCIAEPENTDRMRILLWQYYYSNP